MKNKKKMFLKPFFFKKKYFLCYFDFNKQIKNRLKKKGIQEMSLLTEKFNV